MLLTGGGATRFGVLRDACVPSDGHTRVRSFSGEGNMNPEEVLHRRPRVHLNLSLGSDASEALHHSCDASESEALHLVGTSLKTRVKTRMAKATATTNVTGTIARLFWLGSSPQVPHSNADVYSRASILRL